MVHPVVGAIRVCIRDLVIFVLASSVLLAGTFGVMWFIGPRPMSLVVSDVRVCETGAEPFWGTPGRRLAVRISSPTGFSRWFDSGVCARLRGADVTIPGEIRNAGGGPLYWERRELAGRTEFTLWFEVDAVDSHDPCAPLANLLRRGEAVDVQLAVVSFPFDIARSEWVSLASWREVITSGLAR